MQMNAKPTDRLSCDILIVSLSMSESADNNRTRWPDLSRPMKSFSVKHMQISGLSKISKVMTENVAGSRNK